MRVDAVKEQLAAGLADRYREFTVSSATVELAAQALQCEPGRIAKSLSVLLKEGHSEIARVRPGWITASSRIASGRRPPSSPARSWSSSWGHPQGGVCPLRPAGERPGLSGREPAGLRSVYPAAGAPNNALELHLDELERLTGGQWVDVCKTPEPAEE